MNINDYRNIVRDLLHDPNANFYSQANVDRWINRGRRQTAKTGQCVRYMPPTSGFITSITVNSGGAGYTDATVAISSPDANALGTLQATAIANLSGGAITSFTITNPGFGYIAPPTVTITGSGVGGMGTAVVTPHVSTIPGQQTYLNADLAAIAQSLVPGLGDILGIQSCSINWGAIRPTLAKKDFSWLQAYARAYSATYQGNPYWWALYGQGTIGSFMLYPVPVQYQAMELDTYWSVPDLSSDGVTQAVDLIPEPWCEAAGYYAAYLAYFNAQRSDDARTMLSEHTRLCMEARAATSPDVTPDPYGDP